jgi:hypothetical protein
MSIVNNEFRIGRFTSSSIHRLTGWGKREMSKEELAARPKSGAGSSVKFIDCPTVFDSTALEYIKEKNIERKLGRSLSMNRSGKSALWGHYLQQRVHDMLDTGYELIEDRTIEHPTIKCWAGSPDNRNIRESVAGDIKCYEPKNFCNYVDCLSAIQPDNNTELFKFEFPQEYWQLVSSSILLDTKHIEAIVYMPYFSELEAIRESVDQLDSEDDQRKYGFIKHSSYNELPYIEDGAFYKNLNVFRFTPPQSDKDFLTERVIAAGKLLQDFADSTAT